jgi:long-chain acyl-CoA synthetase
MSSPPKEVTALGAAEPSRTSGFATLPALVASFPARGERDALVAFGPESETLSYARLAERIACTARELRARGITGGDRVALIGPNSAQWIVAYFGVVTAGGVAVPMDPQATAETLAGALAHATPKAVITTCAQREMLARIVGPDTRFWLLDGTGDDAVSALGTGGAHTELPSVDGADLASLLFTSGTTGTPKAVPLTHANLAANLSELTAARLIDAGDRVLLPLPLHHTYPFTAGLLLTLASGAQLVLPAGISGPDMLEACRAGRPTALLAVPRLCTAVWDGVQAGVQARGRFAVRAFDALLAASVAVRRHANVRIGRWLFRAVHARLGGALELIGCGGAKLPGELAWRLEGLGFRVLTGYGLTETSPVLTFNNPRHSQLGSEGRPLPGVEVRIADEKSGARGEILARGPNVFAGYWQNAAATAGAFTADGWFRTGDLGRIDDDGYLHVVGRTKELIVLADGKKFFPEAVEKEFTAATLLREIGVFERGGMLAAVIVPDEDEVRRHGTLREAASLRDEIERTASRLPPYQRFTNYRIVRSPLPRTQLGKLRRHLLPGLFDGAIAERSSDAPAMPEEDRALLATPLGGEIWRWLRSRYPERELTLETSPQLELNVDSLGWVALTIEVERRFNVALRAERLAAILTLRDLLREIEAARRSGDTPHAATPFNRPGPALRALGAVLLVLARLLAHVALRPTVAGVERLPPGPALIAPNHASYLDPLVVAAALPWQRLRRTYWAGWVGVMHTTPFRRLLSRAAQVFPVDPDRDLAAAVRTARELLAQGYDVVWFPEGRRSPTGELQELAPGVGVLVHGIAAAVVPVAIAGSFDAWPVHRPWPRPARVRVAFGEPLDGAGALQPGAVRTRLEHAMRGLLAALCPPASDRSP